MARQRINDQKAEIEAKARQIAKKEAALTSGQKKLAAERSAHEEASAKRSLALDQREESVRRDAKTVRNVRILSGQGVSRSLNRILDGAFESQEVR